MERGMARFTHATRRQIFITENKALNSLAGEAADHSYAGSAVNNIAMEAGEIWGELFAQDMEESGVMGAINGMYGG